jgi:hypothetical protein
VGLLYRVTLKLEEFGGSSSPPYVNPTYMGRKGYHVEEQAVGYGEKMVWYEIFRNTSSVATACGKNTLDRHSLHR